MLRPVETARKGPSSDRQIGAMIPSHPYSHTAVSSCASTGHPNSCSFQCLLSRSYLHMTLIPQVGGGVPLGQGKRMCCPLSLQTRGKTGCGSRRLTTERTSSSTWRTPRMGPRPTCWRSMVTQPPSVRVSQSPVGGLPWALDT